MSLFVTLTISLIVACFFSILQFRYFRDTAKYRSLFQNFFKKEKPYTIAKKIRWGTEQDLSDTSEVIRLELVGTENSDLNNLISEINNYIEKTKGTTDFSVIQSKVERKLNMRYDQSTATLAFPTYLGLMGTFAGVFMGILAFVVGFDGAGNITDSSIQDLLIGVLVSMFTSGIFIGRLPIYCSLYSYILLPWEIENIFNQKLKPYIYISMVTLYIVYYVYQTHFGWGLY